MGAGESGPPGLSVTRAVMAGKERDTGFVTIHFHCTAELTAPGTDMKQRTVTQRVVLVSAI